MTGTWSSDHDTNTELRRIYELYKISFGEEAGALAYETHILMRCCRTFLTNLKPLLDGAEIDPEEDLVTKILCSANDLRVFGALLESRLDELQYPEEETDDDHD